MPREKEYLPLRNTGEKRKLFYLTPAPQKIRVSKKRLNLLKIKPACVCGKKYADLAEMLVRDLKQVANVKCTAGKTDADVLINLTVKDIGLRPEGYLLEINEEGIRLTGQDRAGLSAGIQTLLQITGFEKGNVPFLEISDWPAYPVRCVMIDMGRSTYSLALIKRVIRIMSRLKLNMLHLHLFDDQLMGVKFKKLKLGSENPHAFPVSKLKEIVDYARTYSIRVCPEVESWGHAGSVVYHYPESYGAEGMHEGSSFGVGPTTFKLLEKIYDEVIPCLEKESMIHMGMDEAQWAVLPEVKNPEKYNPTKLVSEIYRIVMRAARRHKKKIQPRLWADHGGRPLAKNLQSKVIIEPWMYWEMRENDIRKKVRDYSSGKTPFIMGAGKSSRHFAGTFGATREWCMAGMKAENCMGVNICLWEGNSLEKYLVSLYAGSDYAWNPKNGGRPMKSDKYREHLTGQYMEKMLCWQTLFNDADETAIIRERGPAVFRGYYVSGAKSGRPVAPTAVPANVKKIVDVTL